MCKNAVCAFAQILVMETNLMNVTEIETDTNEEKMYLVEDDNGDIHGPLSKKECKSLLKFPPARRVDKKVTEPSNGFEPGM